ncbi:hypothetical protein D3C78_1150470 [compost metagenome]
MRLDVTWGPPVVAHDSVEIVHMTGSFKRLGYLDPFIDVIATVEQFIHVHPDADAKVRPGLGPNG